MLNIKNTLDGYLKDVEIKGNTIQDAENLADIRSVGDKVEGQEVYKIPIVSKGKNLFNINGKLNESGVSSAIKGYNSASGNYVVCRINSSISEGAGQRFTNLKGKTITISAKLSSAGNGLGGFIIIYENGSNQRSIPLTLENNTRSMTYTVLTDDMVVAFSTYNGTYAEFTDIQVEIGNIKTKYVPYQGLGNLNLHYLMEKGVDTVGWYRVASIKDATTCLSLFVNSSYYNSPPSSVYFSVITAYQVAKIAQLNAIK